MMRLSSAFAEVTGHLRLRAMMALAQHFNHERMAEVDPSPDAAPDFKAPNNLFFTLDVRQAHV